MNDKVNLVQWFPTTGQGTTSAPLKSFFKVCHPCRMVLLFIILISLSFKTWVFNDIVALSLINPEIDRVSLSPSGQTFVAI